MSDPRTEQNFKQKRVEDRTVLLLGAILDELIKLNAPAEQKAETKKKKQD